MFSAKLVGHPLKSQSRYVYQYVKGHYPTRRWMAVSSAFVTVIHAGIFMPNCYRRQRSNRFKRTPNATANTSVSMFSYLYTYSLNLSWATTDAEISLAGVWITHEKKLNISFTRTKEKPQRKEANNDGKSRWTTSILQQLPIPRLASKHGIYAMCIHDQTLECGSVGLKKVTFFSVCWCKTTGKSKRGWR